MVDTVRLQTERGLVHVANSQRLFQVHPTPNLVLMYTNIGLLSTFFRVNIGSKSGSLFTITFHY